MLSSFDTPPGVARASGAWPGPARLVWVGGQQDLVCGVSHQFDCDPADFGEVLACVVSAEGGGGWAVLATCRALAVPSADEQTQDVGDGGRAVADEQLA